MEIDTHEPCINKGSILASEQDMNTDTEQTPNNYKYQYSR